MRRTRRCIQIHSDFSTVILRSVAARAKYASGGLRVQSSDECIFGDARRCAACGADDRRGRPVLRRVRRPARGARGAERKLATIVFADLVGSTSWSPGATRRTSARLLDPFFEIARTTLEEHGGRVEKFIGDAVMAVFGVPRAHGDDPDRAVAAALALVERLAAAHRARAPGRRRGRRGAGERARRRSGGHGRARPRSRAPAAGGRGRARSWSAVAPPPPVATPVLGGRRRVEAQGFPAPLDAWSLPVHASCPPSPRPATAATGRCRCSGAAPSSRRFGSPICSSARERRPHLALIVGEAGAGKTRLAARAVRDRRARAKPPPLLLAGRNPPYGDGIAFWALAELLRGAAGAPATRAPRRFANGSRSRLRRLGAAPRRGDREARSRAP